MYLLLFLLIVICGWFLFRKHIAKIFNFKINERLERFLINPSIWLLLIFFSFSFLKYDNQQYDYGFGCTFCSKELPYHLKPQIDRYYTFDLLDEDGFELVGEGFRYRKSTFTIKDFLNYGYNDTSVIVKCADSLNNIKYLVSYETGYKNKRGNPEISFKDLSSSDFEQVKKKYQWVELDEKKAGKVKLCKTLSFIGVLLSLFFIFRKLFKRRNRKVTLT